MAERLDVTDNPDRLSTDAAKKLDIDKAVLLIRRVEVESGHRCVVDLLPERYAEAEMNSIPLRQKWYGAQCDITGARIVRGERMMELLGLLGV